MNHELLWAPWRLAYIKGDDAEAPGPEPTDWLPGADKTCFICRAVADNRDRRNLLVHRSQYAAVILNRFPYNNGHLLIAPNLHKAALHELSDEEHLDCQRLLADYVQRLQRLMNAEGFNIGLNLGRLAGAGLPGHVHWHLVPRWNGDTNFMPVVANTKVIPQALDSLWELLHDAEDPAGASEGAV